MSEFRCLAIETSTAHGSVAVCVGTDTHSVALEEGAASSRQVFQAVREVLKAVQLQPAELNCVACGNGPGSFTGLRVAVSAAQGIAYSADIPVCTISTLAALAAGGNAVGQVAACLDARMGEAYLGIYDVTAAGLPEAVSGDRLVDPAAYRLTQEFPEAIPVGAGWEVWPDMLTGHGPVVSGAALPEAIHLLPVAQARFAAGEVVPAFEALPNYIRDNVTQ